MKRLIGTILALALLIGGGALATVEDDAYLAANIINESLVGAGLREDALLTGVQDLGEVGFSFGGEDGVTLLAISDAEQKQVETVMLLTSRPEMISTALFSTCMLPAIKMDLDGMSILADLFDAKQGDIERAMEAGEFYGLTCSDAESFNLDLMVTPLEGEETRLNLILYWKEEGASEADATD